MFKVAVLIFLYVILFHGALFGQQTKGFAYYDELTYELYVKQQWTQLIETGKEANQSGFDYYYLNIRMGIAYFEKKQYFKAISCFKKAIDHNKSDLIAPEYLYLTYQLTNQELPAARLLKKYPAVQERMHQKPEKIFSGLFLEGTYKFHDLNYVSNLGLFNLGLRHRPFPWLSITHSYNRMSFDQIAFVPSQGGRVQEKRNLIIQKGYYFKADLNLAGFVFSPAFNLQQVQTTTTSYPEKVFYFGLSRQINNFHAGLEYSQSEINLFRQKQWAFSLTWYPLYNLNLYLQNQVARHQQQDFINMIALHNLGLRLTSNVWLEVFHQYGNLYNFNSHQAYLLFNGWDNITQRSGATITALLSANVDIDFSFLMEKHNEFNSDSNYNFSVVNSSFNLKF